MGKRVTYEMSDAESVNSSIILFANNSHPDTDPDELFISIISNAETLNQAVIDLLSVRYHTTAGNHLAGQPVFTVNLEPYDHEYRLVAQFDAVFENQIGEVQFLRVFEDDTFEPVAPEIDGTSPPTPMG